MQIWIKEVFEEIMKTRLINKFFTLLGFLILAFVALNMNACSKDKNNNGHWGPWQGVYGPGVGGGHLGNGVGMSADGVLTLQLTFSGQNGGVAGAMGTLWVSGYSVGCSVPPGQYVLQTTQPGQYYNGDFSNIRLMATNGYVIEIYISRGWLTNQQDQYGNRRMFVEANIPGCPTNFS